MSIPKLPLPTYDICNKELIKDVMRTNTTLLSKVILIL